MSLHLKAVAASDPFTYSTGVLKCRTGERKGYLFVRKGRKDEHLHYLTLGCELAPLIFDTAPNRSGLFFAFILLLFFAFGFGFCDCFYVCQSHQRSSRSSLCVVKSSLCVVIVGQGVCFIVKVIKLLGSGQAWSPGQGHQVVRKC